MGSVRQRRKNRATVRKATRRNKDQQRKVDPAANPIIAAHWDKTLTMAQNYKKLGLTVKLGTPAGGVEKSIESPVFKHALGIQQQNTQVPDEELQPHDIPAGEARIIRDSEGEVLKVIYGTKTTLDDDMTLTEQPKTQPKTEVVRQLEEYATTRHSVKERNQSTREEVWLEALYDKYGDEYEKMKWDKKLNLYQQSAGDLKRRILKWKKKMNID